MKPEPFPQYTLDLTLMQRSKPIVDLPQPGSKVTITGTDGEAKEYRVNVSEMSEPIDYFTDPDIPITLPVAAMRRRARRGAFAHVRIPAAVLGFILGVVAGLWTAAAVFHLAR